MASPASPLPPPPPICFQLTAQARASVGPWAIVMPLVAMLYMAFVILNIIYLRSSSNRQRFNSAIIILLTLLCTLSLAVNIYIVYYLAVLVKDDPNPNAQPTFQLLGMPPVTMVIVGVVPFSSALSQIFFAHRTYRVTQGNKLIVGILVVLITGCFIAGVFAIDQTHGKGLLATSSKCTVYVPPPIHRQFLKILHWDTAFLWTSAGVDLILTFIIVFNLVKRWSNLYGHSPLVDRWIKDILSASVTSAGLTSGFCLATAIVDDTLSLQSSITVSMVSLYPQLCGLVVVGTSLLRSRTEKQRTQAMSSTYRSQNVDRTDFEASRVVAGTEDQHAVPIYAISPLTSQGSNQITSFGSSEKSDYAARTRSLHPTPMSPPYPPLSAFPTSPEATLLQIRSPDSEARQSQQLSDANRRRTLPRPPTSESHRTSPGTPVNDVRNHELGHPMTHYPAFQQTSEREEGHSTL